MKRCPQCDFVYHDSDTVCDLDGNTLLPVEGEPDGTIQNTGDRTESWKWLSLVAVLGTALGAVLFVSYHRFTHTRAHDQVNPSPAVAMTNTQSVDLPTLTPESTAAAESSPTPGPRLSATPRTTPVSAKLSSNPVSTTTDQTASGGVTIRLTDGGTVVADEAWSTKQGIWFRRNGVVTLLKRNRVKAIDRGR